MIGKIKRINGIWPLLFLALVMPRAAEAGINEKTFPAPKSVVSKVVASWLQASGFRVNLIHFNEQRTEITAETESERWHIVIRPQSALACHVKAEWTGPGDSRLLKPYESLWGRIRHEIQPKDQSSHGNGGTTPPEVRARRDSVVCMRVVADDGEEQVSGFLLDTRKRVIITTAHDLSEFQNTIVILSSGQEIGGQVVLLDRRLDLAFVRVESNPGAGILLSESREMLNAGERLYSIIGCPANGQPRVVTGSVDGPPRRADDQLLWQVKMDIRPGNSGSPVFDAQGQLVAVVKGRHRLKTGIGFLIPMETVIDFFRSNIDYVQ